MMPLEIRRQAVAEHQLIGGHVARLGALADTITEAGGSESLEALGAVLRALRSVRRAHPDWEDVTRPGTAYDEDRRSARGGWPKASHGDLRAALDLCGPACGGEIHSVVLARRLRHLTQLIRNALSEEEEVVIASGTE